MRYCDACRASFQALTTCPRDSRKLRSDIADPLIGHVLGDRYRVLERIAAGGMGQVYRAAHARIASLFAVKVLYGDIAQDPSMRTRFRREAEVASLLQSRYIVRVVDFDESPEGLLYLAMEHLDGHTLASVVTHEAPLDVDRAVRVALQIARGLAHAHERGVVHRDLKPANVVLIDEDDQSDVVRLLDFGIARLQQGVKLTQAGAIMGTPEYMAPEQFASADVDARADLYALGIILYEMLTGSTPFEGSSVIELAGLHARATPQPMSERGDAPLAPKLEMIVTRLLAKSPNERYPSARAVIDELRELEAAAPSRRPLSSPARPLVDTATIDRVLAAIQVGAPAYNAGDHAGCYRIYRDAAASLDASVLRADTAVAVGARIELAFERAASADNATLAAWHLRYAFDDLLHASGTTAPVRRDGTAEFTAAAAIVAPRYAAGDLDLVGDYYLRFARGLLIALRASASNAALVARLEPAIAAAEQTGGGRRALAPLGSVLGTLQQAIRPTAASLPAPPMTAELHSTPMREVARRIAEAIAVGAPAYNEGDAPRCYRIYAHTAAAVLADVETDPRCAELYRLLGGALERAAREPSGQGAWTLRYAFDAILAAAGET